jgi:hypothetical protein
MSSRICIHLHIELILRRTDHLSLQKVPAFEYGIEQQDVVTMLLEQLLLHFLVLLQEIDQFVREMIHVARTQNRLRGRSLKLLF